MSKKIKIYAILTVGTVILIGLLLILLQNPNFSQWIKANWLEILYAVILAIIVGFIIEYIYKRQSTKSKMLKTTVTPPSPSQKSLAKLVLKENQEFIIKEFERVFGREDFVGLAVTDDLLFIGKEHFKIIRKDHGFYIEDLNTKNGTLVNEEEIRGHGMKRLENGDDILIARTIKVKYFEEKS